MASLRSCIGIHAAPPQLAAEIRRLQADYQKSGFKSQDAVEAALKDVQKSLKVELDGVHAQIKAANPKQVQAAQDPALSPDEQQIADLKAAGLEVARFSDSLLSDTNMVNRIYDKLGGLLTNEEIAQIVGTVESRYQFLHTRLASDAIDIRREFQQMGIDPFMKASNAEFMAMTPMEKSDALLKADLQKALVEKKKQIRRKQQSAKRDTGIKSDLDAIQASDPNISRSNAIIDYMVGNIRGKGVVQNLQAKAKGITDEMLQPLIAPLKPFLHSVRGLVMGKDDYRDLAHELIDQGSSGNGKVSALAKAISDINDAMRIRLNKAGADIGFVDGYIPQQWQRRKLMFGGLTPTEVFKLTMPNTTYAEKTALNAKARQHYVDFMLDKVNRDHRAYVDKVTGEQFTDAQMRDFLANAFDTLSTDGATKGETSGGQGSLASRLSSERSIFFKDADSFLAANDKFGAADVITTMVNHLQARSKDLALMENMDSQNFATALAEARKTDGKNSGGMLNRADRAEAIWMELSGTRASSGTGMLSDTMAALRSWQVFTKLGSALLSQPSDVPTFALMAVKDGLGFAPAVREMMAALNPLNRADRRVAEDLGLAIESVYKDAGSRFMDTTNDKGLAGKMAQFTIKAGGMKWWTDSMKRGFHVLIGRGVAKEAGKGFDALDAPFRTMLERNGIDSATWDSIRNTPTFDLNGREVIAPSMVADPAARAKMFSLFAEEADYGVMEPGARERSKFMGKLDNGSAQGELFKAMLIFKTFSISMMSKTIPRLFSNLEGNKAAYSGHMAAYALAMIGMGAFSTQLKELAKGRNPRDMQDPKFWIAAAGQSGGLGIFGDFVFGDVNRMGQGIGQTLLGPVGAVATDAIKLTAGNIQELAQGKPTKAAAETIQFVKNNAVPNLWYAKQAMDTLIFNRAIETANPGYLQRMQSRVERENNTSFWWKPGDLLPADAPNLATGGGK